MGLSLGFSRVLGGSYCAGPGESTYGGDGAEVGAAVRQVEREVEGKVRGRFGRGSGGSRIKAWVKVKPRVGLSFRFRRRLRARVQM